VSLGGAPPLGGTEGAGHRERAEDLALRVEEVERDFALLAGCALLRGDRATAELRALRVGGPTRRALLLAEVELCRGNPDVALALLGDLASSFSPGERPPREVFALRLHARKLDGETFGRDDPDARALDPDRPRGVASDHDRPVLADELPWRNPRATYALVFDGGWWPGADAYD